MDLPRTKKEQLEREGWQPPDEEPHGRPRGRMDYERLQRGLPPLAVETEELPADDETDEDEGLPEALKPGDREPESAPEGESESAPKGGAEERHERA